MRVKQQLHITGSMYIEPYIMIVTLEFFSDRTKHN